MSLAQHHAACYEAFQRACAIPGSCDLPELPDQFDRYKLWAGNVGAAHSGPTYTLSLDYRLREASFYKEQVSQLLLILYRHIDKAAQLLSGERTPFEIIPLDDRTESATFPPDRANTSFVEADDSPWEISSDSESDASSQPASQPYASSEPATGEDDSELVDDTTSGVGLQELPQTLESIKLTVASLFKLPIRRPAPIDRLNDRATEETSCFQPYDVRYVKDKFQCLEEQLATRLGSMVTQRRQLLLYRKRHWQNLRTDCTNGDGISYLHHEGGEHADTQQNLGSGDHTVPAMQSSAGVETRHDKSRITKPSKATTLDINNGPPLNLEQLLVRPMAQSETGTSTQASEYTGQLRLNVPPRPKDAFGAPKDCFQCPYCLIVQVISSDRAWRKHVLADLQPYVCTFVHCSLSGHFFESREEWYEHEAQHHRIEFFCNTTGHSAYTNQTDFEEHIRTDHSAEMGAELPRSLFGMFKRPLRASEMMCNLCFRKTSNLKRHVARHLEQISLFAIPRADYFDGDEELNDGSNVSQNNAQESRTNNVGIDDARTQISWDTDNSVSKLDQASSSGEDVEHEMPALESLDWEQLEIPDTEGLTWDSVTDKFSQARNGLADAAPSGLVPTDPGQKLPDMVEGRLTPSARFREAVKAIIILHRHRKQNRMNGAFHMANVLIIDATGGHPSQKESIDRLEEIRTVFAQRFADYWPLLRVVNKDTGLLRLDLIKEALKDFLRSHDEPENLLIVFVIGLPGAAVQTMQTSEPSRSLAEVLFKSICREVGGKSRSILVQLDSGNPWGAPTAASSPIFKIEDDVTKDFDEATWTFPMLVSCRPENSTSMSQAVPWTRSFVPAMLRLLNKGRTFVLQDVVDGINAELPKGEKVILLGLDRDRFGYTCQYTPRTLRTGSMNLPSSRSAHITILLVNVACTTWLLSLYRRRLAQSTLSRPITEEPKGETGNAAQSIKPLRSMDVATLAFQKWRLILRIRRLEKRLIQTRALFLWRINPANNAASTSGAPSAGAADDADYGSYSGQVEASDRIQGRGSTRSRADIDFGTPLAEQAVASVIAKGFSISEAEFALAGTSSQDGQISVERALEFLNGLS